MGFRESKPRKTSVKSGALDDDEDEEENKRARARNCGRRELEL